MTNAPRDTPTSKRLHTAESADDEVDDADEATIIGLNGADDGEAVLPIGPLSEQRRAMEAALSLDSKLASYAGQNTPCASSLRAAQQELNRVRRPHVAQVVK